MKGRNTDLFDPRTEMDSDDSRAASDGDFGFGFNNRNFSDRLLRIEIMGGPANDKTVGDGCTSIADWARHRKRRREDVKKDNAAADLSIGAEEQILTCNQPDMDECVGSETQDEDAVAMIEEMPPVNEITDVDTKWSMDHSTVVKVETLPINSLILAAKSPFFYNLFSNGMRESEQRHVTLRINANEEAALMELLKFMYSNTLSTTTATGLLDVLMAADKFEVASCLRYCTRLLRNMDITPESALLYLELPSSILMAEAVQPLTDAAKQYLAVRYKHMTRFQKEVMALPLAGVEAILSSDDLQVASEDAVYDFVLKWARFQYPKLEERREILDSRLVQFIRFPNMTCRKLKEVLTCGDFDNDVASKLVLEAFFFKAEALHRQRILAAEESASLNHRFMERAYKNRPVKVVEFELPRQQCVVYLDLKRDECANLFPSARVRSQAFNLGGQRFFLLATCNMDRESSFHCFGLFLGMLEKGSESLVSFPVEYEFAARSKPTEKFITKHEGNCTFPNHRSVGYRNLFAMPWTSFMAEDSRYFINGVLHLRAELTIRH